MQTAPSLPAGHHTVTGIMPPGYAGATIRVQVFCVTPTATNGVFVATDAHDLVVQ